MPKSDPKNLSKQENKTFDTVYYDNKLEDNIIDLYQILVTVWKWKWLIIAITVFAALSATVYSLQLQTVYEAKAILLPPKEKDFKSLDLLGLPVRVVDETKKIRELNPQHIFDKFQNNLKSISILKKFIQEYELLKILAPERTGMTNNEDVYEGFAASIKLRKDNGITSLSIELNDNIIAAKWVNNLIEFVDRETVGYLLEDLQNSIQNQIRSIEYNINSKRLVAEKRREDLIIRYSEHAEIAKKLGIVGRVDATNIIQTTQRNVDIATASSPLYYLGYEALTTEINVLRNRKSDDPFITGLRDLQEQLALLRSIKIDKNKMRTVRVDQAAYPSKSPIRPDRIFIVSLTTITAFFAGIFLSFFVEFISNQRKNFAN